MRWALVAVGHGGLATRWPNRGICLGSCRECHGFVREQPHLPREEGELGPYLAYHVQPAWKILEFLDSDEVCRVDALFPLNVGLDAYSLAALGAEQVSFPQAPHHVRALTQVCDLLQNVSVQIFAAGVEDAAARLQGHSPRPWPWRDLAPAFAVVEQLAQIERAAPVGIANATSDILGSHVAEVVAILEMLRALPPASGERPFARPDGSRPGSAWRRGAGYADSLTEGAVRVGREVRRMMEHGRVTLGLKNVITEVAQVYDAGGNFPAPPAYRWHSVYGRHWDVLDFVLRHHFGHGARTSLKFLEIGVACAPIGLFLLERWPELEYTGIDPTLVDDVYSAYAPFGDRARLWATRSDGGTPDRVPDRSLDVVFIDGPHTYKQVASDIALYEQKVRPGGLLMGHDFTSAHPPLLWAVSEQRLGGRELNMAMDGVWWWTVD